MMRGYLKVRDACPVCSEDLHHQRADDGPAYLTILIVGHLMAPLMLFVFTKFRPDPLIAASVFSIGCVALSLFLLPRLKGRHGRVAMGQADARFRRPDARD